MKPITSYTSYNEVKKTKKKSLTLIVLEFYKQDFYQKQIADKLNISKERVFYHTKRLLELGYLTEIARSNIVIYKVTKKGEIAINRQQVTKTLTGGEPPKINLHNLPIKIPILKDVEIPEAELNEGLRNVPRQFKKLPFYGLTLTRNVGKNPTIMINVHPKTLKVPEEEFNVVFQAILLANDYLSGIGMVLDLANFHVKGRDMWIRDPVAEQEIEAGRYTRTFLGRIASKVTPRDPDIEAQVWNDNTPGKGMESNDRIWMSNYQKMPDNIAMINDSMVRMAESNEVLAKNLIAHIPWVQKGIKVQNRLYALLTQRRLGDFV